MSRFVGAGKKLMSFITPKVNVPKTKLQKSTRDLNLAIQKNKASKAKLNQTIFEMQNPKFKGKDFTFKGNKVKSESNKESYKRIQGENNKVFKKMIDKATENKKDGGRMGYKGGSDMGSNLNQNINSLKRILDKIPRGQKRPSMITNSRRERSPMERQKVLDTMKSKAQAMGGNVRTAGEMSPLKGESMKSFKQRTEAKVGGRMGYKDGTKGGRKMGGGSNMSNTAIKKKFKNLGNLPETIQIKIAGKKIAKKV